MQITDDIIVSYYGSGWKLEHMRLKKPTRTDPNPTEKKAHVTYHGNLLDCMKKAADLELAAVQKWEDINDMFDELRIDCVDAIAQITGEDFNRLKSETAPKKQRRRAPIQGAIEVEQPVMTDKANGCTYQQFIDAKWTHEQLVAEGYVK